MESTSEIEKFISKSVLAICAAGSDRSKYIAEELNKRGYFATNAGVISNHNYVTPEDLLNVGTVVFSSIHEKKTFDNNPKLKAIINSNNIQVRVLNITESLKDRAHNEDSVDKLRVEISTQLDNVGLVDLNKTHQLN